MNRLERVIANLTFAVYLQSSYWNLHFFGLEDFLVLCGSGVFGEEVFVVMFGGLTTGTPL